MIARSPRLILLALSITAWSLAGQPAGKEKHLLYVASPGCRNYLQYGGMGVLVFDIDNGYRFVKRIPTWDETPGKDAENIKGIAASAKTGKLYVTTVNRLLALDAVSGAKLWE